MKQTLKKIVLLLSATSLLLMGMLLIIILNPLLLYANKTAHNNFVIYHDKSIDPRLFTALEEAHTLFKQSEYNNPNLTLDICLNDGSSYPTLMRAIRGRVFAWGFYNKVVLQGNMDCQNNVVELSGYQWNLSQLIAHEAIHCLQYAKLGLWKSNPIANIPNWKWEGYAEYIARQNVDQQDLTFNIERYNNSDRTSWDIAFADSSITSREYYGYWNLVKYCMDVKKMNYQQLLNDTINEQECYSEMNLWYKANKIK